MEAYMRVLTITALAAGFLVSMPAAAQIAGPPPISSGPGSAWSRSPSIYRQIEKIESGVRDGKEAGQLSPREARALRREGRRIEAMEQRYAADGLSYSEGRALEMRTEMLRSLANAKRGRGRK
jgi:hypothetical protein